MGLTNKKEEQLKRMPIIQTTVGKSKDGKYILYKTTITTIRPSAYYEKILSNEGTLEDKEVQEVLNDELVLEGKDLAF